MSAHPNPLARGEGERGHSGAPPQIGPFFLGVLLTFASLALPHVAAAPSRTLTILYTGDTRGWVEPCGCSEAILGGLPRRATTLRRLRAQSPGALVLEAGSLLGKSSDALKVPLMVRCLAGMGYGAVNLGPADLRWRKQLARELERERLPGISLEQAGGGVARDRIVSTGGVRVGITGLDHYPQGSARRELDRVIAALQGRCDVVVVLSAAGAADNLRLAKEVGRPGQLPAARLVGGRQGPKEGGNCAPPVILIGRAPGKPQLLRSGSALLAPVTPEGGHVGRLTLTLGTEPAAADLELIPLGEAVPDDLPTLQAVQAYYDQVAEELLAKRGKASVEAGYALASSCAYCHGDIHRRWQRLAHARAVADLKRVGRDLAPDCLQCHSEYFRRTRKAPLRPEQRMGVECASCHGEGFMLILRPSKRADAAKPGEQVCTSCHTRERSPHFDFAAYKRKIRHW